MYFWIMIFILYDFAYFYPLDIATFVLTVGEKKTYLLDLL